MSDNRPTSKETYLRLIRYARPYLAAFIVAIVSMITLGLSDAAVPVLLKPLLDGGFVEKNIDSLRQTLALLVLLFLINIRSNPLVVIVIIFYSLKNNFKLNHKDNYV